MIALDDSVVAQFGTEQSSDAWCGSRVVRPASKAAQDLRFRVLRLLDGYPKLSHRDIAESLGVSAGGVNHCLNALIEVGAIKVKNFRDGKRKLRYAYFLTRKGITEKLMLATGFLAKNIVNMR